MKTRIFSLIMILTLVVSLAAFAQGDSKTSFGIIGGVNFQNLNGKDMDGDKLENDMIVGFHAGVNVQLPIAPQFYFQPGLIFSNKGAENSSTILTSTITSTYKLSYIELPLNLVYKAQLGSGYFMLGFGPYVAYAIGGKATIEGGPVTLESDIEFKKEVEIGDPMTTTYFKPLDAGANIFFGYELPAGLFAQFNAQLGLININPDDKRLPDNKLAVKNTGFGLSLGYRF
jgi:hypothetical protein